MVPHKYKMYKKLAKLKKALGKDVRRPCGRRRPSARALSTDPPARYEACVRCVP